MRNPDEIERAITEFSRTPNGGLIVLPNGLAQVNRELIIALAARHRLPAVSPNAIPATGTAHRHPGSHTVGYILEGNYEVKINDGPVQTLKSGDILNCRMHCTRSRAMLARLSRSDIVVIQSPTRRNPPRSRSDARSDSRSMIRGRFIVEAVALSALALPI